MENFLEKPALEAVVGAFSRRSRRVLDRAKARLYGTFSPHEARAVWARFISRETRPFGARSL